MDERLDKIPGITKSDKDLAIKIIKEYRQKKEKFINSKTFQKTYKKFVGRTLPDSECNMKTYRKLKKKFKELIEEKESAEKEVEKIKKRCKRRHRKANKEHYTKKTKDFGDRVKNKLGRKSG